MNQYLYTFQGGNLWRHNTNDTRNEYYGEQYPSRITSVFNESPLENKIFKTLNLEGDDAWSATLQTDINLDGEIAADYFVQKEGAWFSFVRNNGPIGAASNESQWELRSVNGIAVADSFDTTDPANIIITFPAGIQIGSIISVGDLMYFTVGSNPQFSGVLTSISYSANVYTITINSTAGGAFPSPQPTVLPTSNDYWFFIKNPVAESHGVLGHYCIFELTLEVTTPSELFVVESDVMKSFP
jgi:hypothetical protein|tara:strand:- start:121 stop:846 length:726 start_codon:yes stop_codon:yes gene_type:complete